MKLKPLLLFLILFLILNQISFSQSSPDKVVDVKVKVSKQASVNTPVDGELVLQIKDGWHINANKPLDENLSPTVVVFKDNPEVKITKIIYPQPIITKLQFSQSQMALYEGDTIVKFQFVVNKGIKKRTLKIDGEVQYQPCNNQTCLFPTSKPFSFEVKIKK